MKWYDIELRKESVDRVAKTLFPETHLSEKLAYYVLANLKLQRPDIEEELDKVVSDDAFCMYTDSGLNVPLYLQLLYRGYPKAYQDMFIEDLEEFTGEMIEEVLGIAENLPDYSKYILSDLYRLLHESIRHNVSTVKQLVHIIDLKALDSESHEFWLYMITDLQTIRKAAEDGIDEIEIVSVSPMQARVITTKEYQEDTVSRSVGSLYSGIPALQAALHTSLPRIDSALSNKLEDYTRTLPKYLQELSDVDKLVLYFLQNYDK